MRVDAITQGQKQESATEFFSVLLDRIQAIPGIRSAGLASILPLSGMRAARDVTILQPEDLAGPVRANVDMNIVSRGYFETVRSPILRGRDFQRTDRQGTPNVAIVNEQMADRFWRGDAIGRQVRRGTQTSTIVGIIRDGSRRDYRQPIRPMLYVPAAQESAGVLNLVIRTDGNPLSILPLVTNASATLSPSTVIDHPQTLATYANTALAQERVIAWCLSTLATLAIILSSVGLYGAISYSVSQRTAEIGVRMALGAPRGNVIRMVLSGAAKIAAAGALFGGVLSLFVIRYARSLLYGVTETDPSTWLAAVCVLTFAVLLASLLPAFRASRIDPASALRSD